jgi:hypothetical protein
MAVMWVFWFGVRHAIEVVRVRRLQRAHDGDWDQIIASIKFRLPSRAEFAASEHHQSYGGRYTRLGLRP